MKHTMKRTMSFLAALALMLAAVCCAAGEDAQTAAGTETAGAAVAWKTAKAGSEALAAKGAFASLTEIGVKVWVPDELAADAQAAPVVYAYCSQNEDSLLAFTVFAEDLPESVPAGDAGALYTYISNGVADTNSAEAVVINSIPCVRYTIGLRTQDGVTLFGPDGRIVTFVFDGRTETESEDNELIRLMAASIMPLAMDPDAAE